MLLKVDEVIALSKMASAKGGIYIPQAGLRGPRDYNHW